MTLLSIMVVGSIGMLDKVGSDGREELTRLDPIDFFSSETWNTRWILDSSGNCSWYATLPILEVMG